MDSVMVLNAELKTYYLNKEVNEKVNPCDAYKSGYCEVYNRPCDGCYQSSIENKLGD